MAERVRFALVWHMHQPSYRDALSGRVILPWTRLHVTKDYRDMVERLERHPRVHVTFNVTPVLADQIEALAAGASDAYLDVARRPAEELTLGEQRFLVRHFFSVQRSHMLEPHARYRELWHRTAAARAGRPGAAGGPLRPEELRDLQVWFHLAWVDSEYHRVEPVRTLLAKGRGFTEAEKEALLAWGVDCAAATLPAYRAAARRGQVELTTSAYHHPILPLLVDSDAPRAAFPGQRLPVPAFRSAADAAEQLARARATHTARFGSAPRGTWPPEGAVDDAALRLIAAAGFTWTASDESVLYAALGRGAEGGAARAAVHRPYRFESPEGTLALVFRDRALSDRIGFTYMHWEPEAAARDFVDRVAEAAHGAAGDAAPLVAVILDGENCWESYPSDGAAFLDALYTRLGEDERIEPLTVSEALERDPPRETLASVPLGSWIRPDLSVWVGHPEKNRAWEELARVRERLDRAREGSAAAGPEAIGAARDELLAAEASDWFWWYGDDHESAHKEELDDLFRSHLIRAYNLLGLAAPASIRGSLRGPSRRAEEPGPMPVVRATLDGRETDFFEWRGAQLFDARAEAGATERASAALRHVLYGVDANDLYVRIDYDAEVLAPGTSIVLNFAGPAPRTARVPMAGAERGTPVWSGGAGDGGAYARGAILEIRVPFARVGGPSGAAIRWGVVLERDGAILEAAPRSGAFATDVPDAEELRWAWSAT